MLQRRFMFHPILVLALMATLVLMPSSRASAQCDPTQINADPPVGVGGFGRAVSICENGRFAVVGAPADGTVGKTGAAYVYEYDTFTDAWHQIQKLEAPSPQPNDYFGASAAISVAAYDFVFYMEEYFIIIGAPGPGSNGGAGAAYVYRLESGTLSLKDTLEDPSGATGDGFGNAVDIKSAIFNESGYVSAAVVGSSKDDDLGNFSGSAFIYTEPVDQGQPWELEAKLHASDGSSADYFGQSVSIENDDFGVRSVLVGARGADGARRSSGAAYFFEYDDGNGNPEWTQTKKFTASDGQNSDLFGYSVDHQSFGYGPEKISVIIGAHFDGEQVFHSGAAYVYTFDVSTGVWTETKLKSSALKQGSGFGWSVAIKYDYLAPPSRRMVALVGAKGDDGNLAGSGAAYAYAYDEDIHEWSETKLTDPEGASGDGFGESVAINVYELGRGGGYYGSFAVIGAPGDDDFIAGSGSGFLFDLDCIYGEPTVETSSEIHGGTNIIVRATYLEPNTEAYLAYSVRGLGSTYVPPLHVTLDLANPKQIGRIETTDGSGTASWTMHVPPVSGPVDVWFQAAQDGVKTNVFASQIVP